MVAAGCGGLERGTDTTSPPGPASGNATGSTHTTGNDTPTEDTVNIQITIGEQRFDATLTESAAACDPAAQLPATIDNVRRPWPGREDRPVAVTAVPCRSARRSGPRRGRPRYYAPGNDLVLY